LDNPVMYMPWLSLVGVATCLLAAEASSGASSASDRLRANQIAKRFIRAMDSNHKLRVCNAFPYAAPLDVFLWKDKITQTPMAYKECRDFGPNLKPGDKVDFKVGDAPAGHFSISDLPPADSTLLLVIFRHDTLSTAVEFESHVFANLLNAQIAVMDTYRGASKTSARIQDRKDSQLARSEELRYDSVVAVNPGTYEIILVGEDGEKKAGQALVALNRESYIVMRCGVEAQQGQAYPQELVVYPHSDEKALAGAAAPNVRLGAGVALVLAAFAVLL